MKLEEIIPSKKARAAIGIVCAVFISALIFAAGFYVGAEKAGFSRHWEENYSRNMSGGKIPFLARVYVDRNFINPHGSDGLIIKIENGVLTIKDHEGAEKNIIVTNNTTIRKGLTDIQFKDLRVNDRIVVIGAPSPQGEVEAKLIRVMP
jgi:hypothetical protein